MTRATRIQQLEVELKDLEAQAEYGRDHPYAGVCGEDDAREDKIAEIKAELVSLDPYNRKV